MLQKWVDLFTVDLFTALSKTWWTILPWTFFTVDVFTVDLFTVDLFTEYPSYIYTVCYEQHELYRYVVNNDLL